MSTNSRIRTNALGSTVERIATETHIFYDPQQQGAQIVFQGEEYLTSPDGLTVGEKLEGREALMTDLAAIGARTFNAGTDPVTGADLSNISPVGIAAIIRAVYDDLHNERAVEVVDEDAEGDGDADENAEG